MAGKKKNDPQGDTQAPKKPKKGPSPALVKARKDLVVEQGKSKAARKKASTANAELRRVRGGRVLRLILGNAGAGMGGVVNSLIGRTAVGQAGGLLDNDIKRNVVPAALGAGVALFGGAVVEQETADAIALGMTAPLSYELAKAGTEMAFDAIEG
jgi:hypothetical protein